MRTAVIYGRSVTFYSRWLVEQSRQPTLDGLPSCRALTRCDPPNWPIAT